MQAQEAQTGSSLSFYSRGWSAQAAAGGTCVDASSLRRVSMTQKPKGKQGQPHTLRKSLQLAGFPLNALEQNIAQSTIAIFHDSLWNLSLTSLAKSLSNYIRCKLGKNLHQQTDYCVSQYAHFLLP